MTTSQHQSQANAPVRSKKKQHHRQQDATHTDGQCETLEHVSDKCPGRRPIETVPRLDHEGGVQAKRQAEERRGESERPDVQETGEDGAVPQRPDQVVQPLESTCLPPCENDQEANRAMHQPELRAGVGVLLALSVPLLPKDAAELRGQGGAERPEVQGARQQREDVLAHQRAHDDERVDVHDPTILVGLRL